MSKAAASPSAVAADAATSGSCIKQGALNVFQVAQSPKLANRRVAEKRIHVDCANLWLLQMYLETFRKGVDPSYEPGHRSFWPEEAADDGTASCSSAPSSS